jgi:hypothetical protein
MPPRTDLRFKSARSANSPVAGELPILEGFKLSPLSQKVLKLRNQKTEMKRFVCLAHFAIKKLKTSFA